MALPVYLYCPYEGQRGDTKSNGRHPYQEVGCNALMNWWERRQRVLVMAVSGVWEGY